MSSVLLVRPSVSLSLSLVCLSVCLCVFFSFVFFFAVFKIICVFPNWQTPSVSWVTLSQVSMPLLPSRKCLQVRRYLEHVINETRHAVAYLQRTSCHRAAHHISSAMREKRKIKCNNLWCCHSFHKSKWQNSISIPTSCVYWLQILSIYTLRQYFGKIIIHEFWHVYKSLI